MIKTKSSLFLGILLFVSFVLRFFQLGYSDFYGDETKVFYLDKTKSAFVFLMDQRKGPVQFVVAWVMEQLTTVPHEFYTRVPFALAGFLSVIVFYFLSKKLFNDQISLIATFLFSLNGFNVAFSRTVQYQSFLLLFGLLSVYLFLNKRYFLSAISLAISFLSHYDATFFLIPLLYFSFDPKISKKELLVKFLVPFSSIIGIFYIPYVFYGYFQDNTFNYLVKRIGGDINTSKNYSAFTVFFYNPCFATFIFILFPLTLLFKSIKKETSSNIKMLLLWFIVPFIIYQFFMTNPGTHIHNYFIPVYLLSGYAISYLYELVTFKKVYMGIISVFFVLIILRTFNVYIPFFSTGYPWNVPDYADLHDKYQLFAYGLPYNRNWREIRQYFLSLDERVEGVFTNDNDVAGSYYLREFNYTRPGTNFLPQYYIEIKDNQQFVDYKVVKDMTREEFYSNYGEVVKIGESVTIYKRLEPNTTRSLGSLLR